MMSGEKSDDSDFSDEDEEGEQKVVQLNLNQSQEAAKKKVQTVNSPVSLHMLDINWIFEETSDGRDNTYGDLMVILDNAPRRFIDTQFVKTFIKNLWADYLWAILKFKLLPQIFYLVVTVLYYSYLLFNDGFVVIVHPDGTKEETRSPEGLKPDERYTLSVEFVVRCVVIALILYHAMYEFMQLWRFKADYFADTANWVDLTSIILNSFIIIYHVQDF